MTFRRTARAAFAAAVLAALPLAGCGGGHPAGPGPFGNGGSTASRLCGPLARGGVFTAGSIAAFRNSGPAAVIDKVSLSHLRGLRLLAGYAVPITGDNGYGNLTGYPPRDLSPGVLWSQRQPADGARIPPSHGHAYIDLVLVVKLMRATGSADGVDVSYHTPAGHYHLHVGNGLTLTTTRTSQACPP